ncbi:MAG TPA: peptidyl-prolyl cis-trans isomerase [Solirubrobacteraceae bacterium]|nr:peptidyl-prolyl cis-trans isomerase [Solirubrobacteraceae bacterium]
MSKSLRSLSALGAVLFALVGISACGGIPGDAVVQVSGTPIAKTAFEHWMKVASASSATGSTEKPVIPEPPNYTACIAHLAATTAKPAKGQKAPTTAELKSQCATEYKSLQSEVLGFLISSQWVLGEASSLGIKLSDAEVKKEFAKIKAQEFPKPSEFEKFLSTSGQTVSDLLLRVKLNLLSQKIEKKIIKEKSKVSEAQVQKYYNENKSKYGTPEKRNVQIILTKTEAVAKSAKKEVESGKSFASVAKSVSIDPTSKANGGLLKEVVKGEEEQALDTAIFAAAKNVLGGPVKTPFGYYVYEVLSTTPGTQQPLSKVKATVKQQLISTGEQSALTKFTKGFKTKWKSKTECRSGYIVADCSSYKAPKTSATGASKGASTVTPE